MIAQEIEEIDSRQEMIRFFDGYSLERKEEIDERKAKRPLVKSYLLEITEFNSENRDGIQALFARRGLTLKRVDEQLYKCSKNGDFIGFLEPLLPRIVAIYSVMESKCIDPYIRKMVYSSPEIDHVWLSGLTFNELWKVIIKISHPNRFARLVFTHESVYDVDSEEYSDQDEEDDQSTDETEHSEEAQPIFERRAARFQLVDRIKVVNEKLETLQRTYAPLCAISQLRFPSPVGRGGHDFYHNGKVTNRSDSFKDHRSHLIYVTKVYEKLLRKTESKIWYGGIQTSLTSNFQKIVGAPLVIRFSDPLEERVFNYWMDATFKRPKNKFRLWGHPIRLGPTKVHVYGLDRHLWRPIFLEFTNKGCIAVLPQGTCGNTIHRLVANIQTYIDPDSRAFLGDQPYSEFVVESTGEIHYADAE